ncbi:MAG: chromate transporter [Clostridia bacterium]|nr:chromate transporter [Clostridia bacterium]
MSTKAKTVFQLFITFLKIGAFTFGGGYAMIALLESEFVSRKKWLEKEEYLDMLGVAESTPGPIAVNTATFIGYKKAGIFGSVFSTLGVCLPSFVIIFIISLFFERFLELRIVSLAFKGIGACVVYLIFSAGVKMFKNLKRDIFTRAIFLLVLAAFITFYLISFKFSTIYYILICGALGVFAYLFGILKGEKDK